MTKISSSSYNRAVIRKIRHSFCIPGETPLAELDTGYIVPTGFRKYQDGELVVYRQGRIFPLHILPETWLNGIISSDLDGNDLLGIDVSDKFPETEV